MREAGRAPPPFRPSLPAVPRGQFSFGPRRPLPLHSGADCTRDAHETGFLHHPPADGACICAADPPLEPVTRRQTPLSVYQVCPSDRVPEAERENTCPFTRHSWLLLAAAVRETPASRRPAAPLWHRTLVPGALFWACPAPPRHAEGPTTFLPAADRMRLGVGGTSGGAMFPAAFAAPLTPPRPRESHVPDAALAKEAPLTGESFLPHVLHLAARATNGLPSSLQSRLPSAGRTPARPVCFYRR